MALSDFLWVGVTHSYPSAALSTTSAFRPVLANQPLRSSAGKLPFDMAGINRQEGWDADFRRDANLCRLRDSRRHPRGKALDLSFSLRQQWD